MTIREPWPAPFRLHLLHLTVLRTHHFLYPAHLPSLAHCAPQRFQIYSAERGSAGTAFKEAEGLLLYCSSNALCTI